MTKNISEEIIEKNQKLPETHKQEIENISLSWIIGTGNILTNSEPVAREIEEYLFSFILKDIKLSEFDPHSIVRHSRADVLFWDYQE